MKKKKKKTGDRIGFPQDWGGAGPKKVDDVGDKKNLPTGKHRKKTARRSTPLDQERACDTPGKQGSKSRGRKGGQPHATGWRGGAGNGKKNGEKERR